MAADDDADFAEARGGDAGAAPEAAPSGGSAPQDPWVARARPGFLYVMYLLLLWAMPMGVIAAVDPHTAAAMARGMGDYLSAIPEPLYALFGTGYLGYTVARSWDRTRGAER